MGSSRWTCPLGLTKSSRRGEEYCAGEPAWLSARAHSELLGLQGLRSPLRGDAKFSSFKLISCPHSPCDVTDRSLSKEPELLNSISAAASPLEGYLAPEGLS